MDVFKFFDLFTSSPAIPAAPSTSNSTPDMPIELVDQERGGSGGNAYCIIAWKQELPTSRNLIYHVSLFPNVFHCLIAYIYLIVSITTCILTRITSSFTISAFVTPSAQHYFTTHISYNNHQHTTTILRSYYSALHIIQSQLYCNIATPFLLTAVDRIHTFASSCFTYFSIGSHVEWFCRTPGYIPFSSWLDITLTIWT